MELIVWPDLVGPWPVSLPEGGPLDRPTNLPATPTVRRCSLPPAQAADTACSPVNHDEECGHVG